jgi:hypothetical protein
MKTKERHHSTKPITWMKTKERHRRTTNPWRKIKERTRLKERTRHTISFDHETPDKRTVFGV